jgi:GDP-mannose 6-dehydrogenase
MRVAVFGLGYVGFTAATCIASQGHTVVGVDVSDAKINDINSGLAPFEEPGLQELMRQSIDQGRLSATKNVVEALSGATVAMVCVGTPSGVDGAHDMRFIAEISRQIAASLKFLSDQHIAVIYRSTMRPGSMRHLITPIFESILGASFAGRVDLIYNPEFLREAQAIHDYFNPAKIVVGTLDGNSSEVMEKLNFGIDSPIFYTPYEEAELTKFVDNSWHAVKVAFANEIGRTCQKLNISAATVHKVFVADTKLNISSYYTRPGGAFGGSCLPKDVRALQFIASDIGANTHLIDSLLRSNEAHKNHQFEEIAALLPQGGRVLMVGLAFKANTDDLRESPNVDLARKLLASGFVLKVFDPVLVPAKLRGQNLGYAYANLPTIDELLVSKEVAEAGPWDLVVASNATITQLMLPQSIRVISTHSIS